MVKQTLWKQNFIFKPKEHKGLDMEKDTRWGVIKVLNIPVSCWDELNTVCVCASAEF